MNSNSVRRQSGVSLIEALISLVILAVGFLSIVKLNTHLIDVAGTSKARAEAVALATSKLAQLRNTALRTQYDADGEGEGSDEPTSSIAAFNRAWEISDRSATSKSVLVTVSWKDKFASSDADNQQVSVGSIVAWQDPKSSFAFSTSSSSAAGSFATAPTGQAEVGTGTTEDNGTATSGPTGGVGSDGLKIKTIGGKLILYDPNAGNAVRLVMPTVYNGFSTVEGYVYVSVDKKGIAIFDTTKLHVLVSDAAYCWTGGVENFGAGPAYVRFPYRCYVGAEWYGNVGVVSTENKGGYVCIGDPSITYSAMAYQSDSGSRQPALTASRHYRGYKLLGGDVYQSTGIGVDSNGAYTPANKVRQDFLVTSLSGNSKDWSGETCEAPMELVSPDGPFIGNAGKYVCLSSACPDPWPDVASATLTSIVVAGTISQRDGDVTSLVDSIQNNEGWTCVLKTYDSATKTQDYSCSVHLQGYNNSVWGTEFTVVTNGTLCTSGASGSGAVDPSNDTITFSGQSVANVAQTQDFAVASDPAMCP